MNSKFAKLSILTLCAAALQTLPAQTHSVSAANPHNSAASIEQDPTPITGGASYGAATAITAGITYSSAHTTANAVKSIYFLDVAPGERVTVTASSSVVWPSGTVYFYWYDQDHVSYLDYVGVSGAEQTKTLSWMGNSTTPTRYYLLVEGPSTTPANPYVYTFTVAREAQHDGGAANDAPETGVNARTLTQALNSTVTYTGTLGHHDLNDYYSIPAVSGQIISVSLNFDDYGANTTLYAYIYDAANTSTYLSSYLTFRTPDKAPQTLNWMSNAAKPGAYVIRVGDTGATNGKSARYSFSVTLSQQSDAGAVGDAGDDFDTARLIDDKTVADTNALGQSDKKDFYKIGLPDGTKTFGLIVAPPNWAGKTIGYLKIQKYSATRALLGPAVYLQAPQLAPAIIDITGCVDCFVSVEDQTNGTERTGYSLSVKAPNFVFIPIVRK